MKISRIILWFIFFALIFNIKKSIAQDTTLINTFNAVISKVDTGFLVDTTSNIDSVQIDNLNNLYFVKGIYVDTTNEDSTTYGKIYVLKYDNHEFSIIDSTTSFIYDYYYTINRIDSEVIKSYYTIVDFKMNKDTLFIYYDEKRTSNNYKYTFNTRLQIYQLVSFGTPSINVEDTFRNEEHTSSINYDIKKQLLSWKIPGIDEEEKIYEKSGKKKIILPKDFPIQLRQFEPDGVFMDDCDSILSQIGK